MNTLLEAEHLTKVFAQRGKEPFKAVDDVSFSLQAGETLGIVGESGSGKTTIGRAIIRINEAAGGEILYKGERISGKISPEMDRKVIENIQMIFQDPYASLNPRMTVGEIIKEPMEIHGILDSSKDREDRAAELLKTVGLKPDHIRRYPHEFSGGQRQRISIARTLALNPRFIICDEPISALDVSIQAQILNLMQDLQEQMGLTYIFITHDLSVVNHFANDIAVMYLGQLIEKAPSVTLFDNPVHPYTKALLSAIPVPSLRKKRQRVMLKGEISSPINPKPGCRFAVRCPYATDRCRTEEPKLVEIEKDHFVACHLTEK